MYISVWLSKTVNCNLAVAKPSPLGRVAERSEGRERFVAMRNYLFRQPFGLPPSPKGKAWVLPAKLQFGKQLSQADMHIFCAVC